MRPGCNSRPFTGAWIETWSRFRARASVSVAPSRGRGLKPAQIRSLGPEQAVAPSRGRGLKLIDMGELALNNVGRPFTGAWIETLEYRHYNDTPACRPFTGAWIETYAVLAEDDRHLVAPSRGRGLKHAHQGRIRPRTVAPSRGRGLKPPMPCFTLSLSCRPFTGAWIETRHRGAGRCTGTVAPSRGRGLKLVTSLIEQAKGRSPLHGGVD